MKKEEIVSIICVRNAEKYIEKCIESIKKQNFTSWGAIIIDDCSEDNTCKIIEKTIDKRFLFIKNIERKYALKNIYTGIVDFCENKNSIIALIDGDDWLCDENTFSYVYETHKKYDMVYTQFKVHPSGVVGWNKSPCDPIRNPGNYSHMKTFKKFLFDKIEKGDLMSDGEFYKYAYDKAIMYPIAEMCGLKKIGFIDKVCYVYNDENCNNVHKNKENQKEQTRIACELLSKKSYECLY
jgi:glycosyltransferase involved in cell wall biosynthesis